MLGVDGRWIGAFGVAWIGLAFNTIVHAKNQAETALASVGVMVKKRWDLIPSLVDAVQRYVEHESQVLEEVVRLRAQATAREVPPAEATALDGPIGRALGQLLVTAEAYPELEASDEFQQLQRALNEVEEQISASRRSYNAAAKSYNDAVRMFPTNLLAALLGYRERGYFETTPAETQPPDVMGRFRAHARR
ncbi:MAG: LemA family protein [Proteobacteria bacterium]|nr:MAG: LemA family protein [Pseudomonadota bacterium]